ncbi:MAG: glycosyltransferase [Deltaproteobacteria bacterium]|nr:glycosyltransferase [Deltaproteobacteria bacterium]
MKILFFNPSNGVSSNENPPVGLLYLASIAREQGFEADLYDQAAPENKLAYSMDYVKNFAPDICAFSLFTFNIKTTFAFMAQIRKELPGCTIIAGGHHATALPEKTMEQCKDIDFLFVGEGENSVREFLCAFKEKGPVKGIRGIYYREGGRTVFTGPREMIKNLDDLPMPAHDLIQKYNYQSEGIIKGTRIANISGSRGCPFSCTYCNKAVFGSNYRRRSPKNIIAEIRFLFEKFGYDEVFFHDELFTGNKKWLEEFYREIDGQGLKFPWRCLGRVGTVDKAALSEMKEHGCYIIAFGIESGNPDVREKIKRPMTNEDIIQTFKDADEVGLLTYAFNIIGHPPETHETVKDTFDLMVKTNPHFAPVFICCPLPGSPIYNLLPEDIKYDWDRFHSYRSFDLLPISISSLTPSELVDYANQLEVFFIRRLRWLAKNVIFGPYPFKSKWRYLNRWVWANDTAAKYLAAPNRLVPEKRGLLRLKCLFSTLPYKIAMYMAGTALLRRVLKLLSAAVVFIFAAPLCALLYMNFFFMDAFLKLGRKRAQAAAWLKIPDKSGVSIIIVNWNGKDLLRECLGSVTEAMEHDGRRHELIVVDNGSTDGSVAFVRENYPQAKVVGLDRNYGFGEGNNRGASLAVNEIIVFLNNDMVVEKDFLRPLIDGFTASDIFAVSGQIFPYGQASRCETGRTSGYFSLGEVKYSHDPVKKNSRPGYYPIYWAGGGSTAYDKSKFLSLGGFNKIFTPCYGEDTDMSHNAWKRGWSVLFTPESRVYHKHRTSSVRLFGERYIDMVVEKNKYLLIWKNITDPAMVFSHFFFLPLRLAYLVYARQGYSSLCSFLFALRQFPSAMANRAMASSVLSDSEVFSLSKGVMRHIGNDEKDKRLRILFITAFLPSIGVHAGGGRMFKIIEMLSKEHDVRLISFYDAEEQPYIAPLERLCLSVDVIILRLSPCNKPLEASIAMLRGVCSEEMRALIKGVTNEFEFDIIQFEYTAMAQYLADIDSPGSRNVLTEHEVSFANYYRLFSLKGMAIYRPDVLRDVYGWAKLINWEVDACRKFDKVVCMTSNDAQELRGLLPEDKLAVINTGVDTSFFSPGSDDEIEPDSLIFVGGYRHYPNVDAVVYFVNEILPLIRKEAPGVRLYVVGSYPPPELIDAVRHDSNIIVTGLVEDLRVYLRKAGVFVVPLRLGCGIRGKVLEAWAMAKPVVATTVAGAGLEAIHGENILIADSPEDFARETIRVLRDPALGKRLGLNGRDIVVRKYDWSMVGEKISDMYRTLAMN